jgi:beta-1,4-mannosyl-glycoprotein beta-1,4-N-acetylglucosaminyltransferase
LAGWQGDACSIPHIVQYSDYRLEIIPRPRTGQQHLPRRIINAFPFNIEFEVLEARFIEIGDVVDVFLILESNFTAYGDPKPLRLLTALQQGKYAQYAHKIVHVVLDYFPKEAYKDGWIVDNLLRDHIVTQV